MRITTSAVRLALFVAVFTVCVQANANFCTNGTNPNCDPSVPSSPCYNAPPPPPTCQGQGSGMPASCSECKKCTSSPVFAASGAYETSATDLHVPTNGFPLDASRYYSSVHAIDGPTGFGWSSTFHARVHHAVYLFSAPSTYQRQADVIMPDGNHYLFQDNGNGTFAPPAGRYDTLVQNADGTFDLTLQHSRSQLHFSSDGNLQSITDDYGNTLTYTYDTTTGRLQRVSDASGSGRYLDVIWAPNGRISAIQDNSGRAVQYTYNTNGTLASVTNAAGQMTTYTYVAGRYSPVLSQIKDHWGRVISDITWDTQGRLKSYTEQGETFTYTYNYNGTPTQTAKQDSGGNTWIYPTSNSLITEKRPPAVLGAASSFTTYNADGTIQLATDETGVKTSYTYLDQGRIASVTKDSQGTTAVRFDYAYDPNFADKVTSILPKNPTTGANDPNWQGWKYDYNPPGSTAPSALNHVYRLRDDGTTADTIATYTYDGHGHVLSVTDALGAETDYAYDAAGNLATVTAPANNDAGTRPVTSYSYDAVGRVTSVTDALGKTTTYVYDALDRIASVTLPPPSVGSPLNFTTTYSYDNFDAPSGFTFTNVTDPNAIVTKQGYDQFGRLRQSIDGLSNATTYAYTKNLLAGITDANNNTTTYQYDALKRLTATVFPNSAQETYAYFADGLLRTKTDRKTQTITYAYDAQKRLKSKTYPNGTSLQYTYQGQKLTQVVDNSVSSAETHTFAYDNRFRVTTNGQTTRATITYTYDDGDRTTSYALSGGPTASYAYYPDGSLNTITWSAVTGSFKYAYNARGQYQSITSPNGASRSFSYDDQGRLVQLANAHPTAGNLATFAYGYDAVRLGQRTSMTADVPSLGWAGAQTTYAYDGSYQLTSTTYPNVTPFAGEAGSWTYDAIGNRTSATTNGTTTSYTYQKIGTNPLDWQRLLTAGATSYTYDNNGNTATMTGSTFGVDYENRLSSVSGSVAATYKYDYQGRRTTKTVGATTTYAYDGLNLIRETGTMTNDYLFGPGIDEPLAVSHGGSISYYAVDGLGSVVSLADAAGATQNTYAYDAWGLPRAATEAVPQPFRYTAREVGDVASQWFYRARYYQTDVGRFLSEDPLQEFIPVIGAAAYNYVGNNPVIYDDPFGMQADKPCHTVVRKGHRAKFETWTQQWEFVDDWWLPNLLPSIPRALRGKAGGGIFGPFTWNQKCLWNLYFISTWYFRQHYWVYTTCECPYSFTEEAGYEDSPVDMYKRRIRSEFTNGRLGPLGLRPCARPTL